MPPAHEMTGNFRTEIMFARRHGLDAMSVAGGMRAWLSSGRPAVWPGEMTLARSTHGPYESRAVEGPEAAGRQATLRSTTELHP